MATLVEDFPNPTVIAAGSGWLYAYATQALLDGRARADIGA